MQLKRNVKNLNQQQHNELEVRQMSQYPLWNQLNTLKGSVGRFNTYFRPKYPRFSEFEKVKSQRYSMLKIMGFMYNVGVS